MKTMHLLIATPLSVAVNRADVVAVKAEDYSGSFGILPGHCEFMTALPVSVLTFRTEDGKEHHAAVRGGILTMQGGKRLEIATREAVVSDDLPRLRHEVLRQMADHAESEAQARTDTMRLQLAVMRQVYRYLRGERPPVLPTLPGTDGRMVS